MVPTYTRKNFVNNSGLYVTLKDVLWNILFHYVIHMNSSLTAIILSGGFATRLYPLTLHTSKSLLPLGGRFVIDFQVDVLVQVPSIGDIYVVTNKKFYSALQCWRDASPHKERITLVSNGVMELEDRKGTMGDLYYVLQQAGFNNNIVVLGNDNLFEDPLGYVVNFAKRQNEMVVAVNEFAKTNCISQSHEIVLDKKTFQIQEFRDRVRQVTSPYYAACLYMIPKHKLSVIADYLESQGYHPEPAQHFISWALENKHPFYGYLMPGLRFDTGDHNSYKKTCEWFDRKLR